MEKHELEKLQNIVKSKVLDKIAEYLDDEVIDVDSVNCLGKLYTRIYKAWVFVVCVGGNINVRVCRSLAISHTQYLAREFLR